MRLVRFRSPEGPRVAVLEGDLVRPLELEIDSSSMRAAIAQLGTSWDAWQDAVARSQPLSIGSVQLLAPIDDPPQLIAIGLNYLDHADESGTPPPAEPLVFAKLRSSIVGPGDVIHWDTSVTSAVDYEAELGVVIAQRVRSVEPSKALEAVFGYTCLNDVSARDLQFADGQWVRGKSLATFCPMGPAIVCADEIADPQQLRVTCELNGTTVQDAMTADMVFGVAELVSRLSRWFELQPGDVIATGTPHGVGWFREPKVLLGDGDVVAVRISSIGELSNRCSTTDGAGHGSH